MKYFTAFISCVLMLFLFHGCSSPLIPATDPTLSTEYQETTSPSSNIDRTQVVASTDFYELTRTDWMYTYTLFDKDGNIAMTKTNLPKEPKIIIFGDNIIRVTTQAGTGIATQSGFYYDPNSNTTSQVYNCIFDQKDNLVAFISNGKVVIQSIFDSNGFYQEITSFQKPFSRVVFPFVNVEFCEDGSSVCVTYYSGDDYENTSETFPINK